MKHRRKPNTQNSSSTETTRNKNKAPNNTAPPGEPRTTNVGSTRWGVVGAGRVAAAAAAAVAGILLAWASSHLLKIINHRRVPTTTTTTASLKPSSSEQHLMMQQQQQRRRWQDFSGIAPIYNHRKYRLVNNKTPFPHDPKAFCQGLYWDPRMNRLVESTGQYGESQVRIWDPFYYTANTNTNLLNQDDNDSELQPHQKQQLQPDDEIMMMMIEQTIDLEPSYFGEGLCWFQDDQGRDRYIQLTWQEQTAFIYETSSTIIKATDGDSDNEDGDPTDSKESRRLILIHSLRYTTSTNEGWGITFDPLEKVFYVSDGSDQMVVWNLQLEPIRTFQVTLRLDRDGHDARRPLKFINELEWDPIDGTLLANIWFQNVLVRIHPKNGHVLEIWDLSQLYPVQERMETADVLNGIAHYRGNQWWVTGKYWPHLYLVELN